MLNSDVDTAMLKYVVLDAARERRDGDGWYCAYCGQSSEISFVKIMHLPACTLNIIYSAFSKEKKSVDIPST